MRLGSLCSGAGGLDMAVERVFGAETVWHCELDPAASKVLAHRWPGVPNHHDLIATDWATVEPIDILAAGYPCQPFSHAGQRKGTEDVRHLWPYVAEAIRVLRPRHVVLENVAGHRSMGFDRVLADLAGIGYVGSWRSLRASDVGAPHRRERLFVLATDARDSGPRREADHARGRQSDIAGSNVRLQPEGRRTTTGSGTDVDLLPTPKACDASGGKHNSDGHQDSLPGTVRELLPTPRTSDTNGAGLHGQGGIDLRTAVDLLCTPSASDGEGGKTSRSGARIDELLLGGQVRAYANGDLLPTPTSGDSVGIGYAESWDELTKADGRHRLRDATNVADLHGHWGKYAAAIARWETVTRPAPAPTEPNRNGKPRLNPAFSEWMMGWPAGWVTDVPGISRNEALKIIGNGVCVQQGIAALTWLLSLEVAA